MAAPFLQRDPATEAERAGGCWGDRNALFNVLLKYFQKSNAFIPFVDILYQYKG